jgi:hypothetical protein
VPTHAQKRSPGVLDKSNIRSLGWRHFPAESVLGCDWSQTHLTLLDWLDGYCCFHHDKKTYGGWGLVAGTGKRQMVAPDDPRHPKNRPKEHSPPAAA